jgi:undecaprenyl-diphosphatase
MEKRGKVSAHEDSARENGRKSWHRKQKQRFAIILLIVVSAILASFYFDSVLMKGVSLLRNPVLDGFFLFVTKISSEVIIFLFLTALFLWKDHKRRWILPLWLTFAISTAAAFLLKVTIQRQRPFQLGIISLLPIIVNEASYSIWNFSFPSNHALLAFCAIPILSEQYPRLKKVWIAIAVIIALSRIYLGVHFFSDVIAGAFIGYLIGFFIVKLEKEYKFGKNIYNRIFGK